MRFTIKTTELGVLQEKAKLYSAVSRTLKDLYIKVSPDGFEQVLAGGLGMLKTIIPISDLDFDDAHYYQIDYQKWTNAIQKYGLVNDLELEIKGSILSFSSASRSGTIAMAVQTVSSQRATQIDGFIRDSKAKCPNYLPLTQEFLAKVSLLGSLFIPQMDFNSIGVNCTSLMNNIRIILGKLTLQEAIPVEFFGSQDPETYIYLHNNLLALMPLLAKTSPGLYFQNDYQRYYWEDSDSSLYMSSEPWEISLPTPEDWAAIVPQTDQTFDVPLEELQDTLQFFDGFYESSKDWKPITFRLSAHKALELEYDHPTTKIAQPLSCIPEFDAEFMIDAGVLSKVLAKVKEGLGSETMLHFTYGEDYAGVLMEAGDDYQFLLAILQGGND